MSTRGDPPDPSIPWNRPSRDPSYRAVPPIGNVRELADQLRSCFDWTSQANAALAQYLEDLQTLAPWLVHVTVSSSNPDAQRAAAALQSAVGNLEQLIGGLETANYHGPIYIRDLDGD